MLLSIKQEKCESPILNSENTFVTGVIAPPKRPRLLQQPLNSFFGTFLVFPSGFNLLLIDKLMKKNAQFSSLPMQKLLCNITLLLRRVLSPQIKVTGRFINHFIHFLADLCCSIPLCLVLVFIEKMMNMNTRSTGRLI